MANVLNGMVDSLPHQISHVQNFLPNSWFIAIMSMDLVHNHSSYFQKAQRHNTKSFLQ